MIKLMEMDMTNSLEKKEMRINSSLENLSFVEKEIEPIFDEFNVSFDLFGNVLIAVTEAVNNAIQYGNRNDVTKQVLIRFQAKNQRLSVVIADEGQGFDYESLPDPTAPENLEKMDE